MFGKLLRGAAVAPYFSKHVTLWKSYHQKCSQLIRHVTFLLSGAAVASYFLRSVAFVKSYHQNCWYWATPATWLMSSAAGAAHFIRRVTCVQSSAAEVRPEMHLVLLWNV